jgi:putative FmdB family regulatory protein
MDNNYWYEFTCTNCKKKFRALQKDADDVIQCPFCKIRPWGFCVSGTEKKG